MGSVVLDIKNSKENQIFNSLDVLSILMSFMMVIAVCFGFYWMHCEQKKLDVAKNYAEKLAQELIKQPVISSLENKGRMPASIQAELDPWGQPYKQIIVRNSYGQPIYLVILSGGPKKRIVTQIPEIISTSASQIENLKIDNSDIGRIMAFR